MQDNILKKIDDAITELDYAQVQSLLEQDMDFATANSERLLGLAAYIQDLKMVELLIELGCDVNGVGDFGNDVALDTAIQINNPAIVELLLKHGANPNIGRQVMAAARHSLTTLRHLESFGADLHKVFTNEHTGEPMNALSVAVDWGKDDVAEYLRSKGAVLPNKLHEKRTTPHALRTLDEEVVAYFTEHIGPVQQQSLVELVPNEPPITVHVIPATAESKCVTLFTTGMSAQAMKVPEGEEDLRFAELFIQLPEDWKYRQIEDPNYGWPIHWLRSLAKEPHQQGTALGDTTAIVKNGNPPQPLAPNTQLTCLLLMAEMSFNSSDERIIRLYRLVPLHTQESDLELSQGIGALMRTLDAHSVPFVVDPNRPSTVTS